MKLKTVKDLDQESVDLKALLVDFADKYDSVFIQDFGESGTFIFTSLGRKDFRDIVETKELSNASKEEVICERCTLYPENYDFANCEEAGLPTELCNLILERSLLKDSDQLSKAIHYCRDKFAQSLDDQITCTIHEAFPEFTVEDIGNWDVAKTADYMVRAEYILHNLRGVPLTPVKEVTQEELAQMQAQQAVQQQPPQPQEMSMEERFQNIPEKKSPYIHKEQAQPVHNDGKVLHKDDVLTPQKLAELQRLYPDIDWAHDSVAMRGTEALKHQSFDDRPVAEIPLDDSENGENAIPPALRNRFKVIKEK